MFKYPEEDLSHSRDYFYLIKPLSYLPVKWLPRTRTARMNDDTPATSRKRPAFSTHDAEARHGDASRLASTPQRTDNDDGHALSEGRA